MSRRSNGPLQTWAAIQRQQQEAERRQRAHEREVAQGLRRQETAYRRHRAAEAQRRTDELEARAEALRGLLAAGCRAPAFRPGGAQRLPEQVEPFDPGHLAQPVPMPQLAHFQGQSGWSLTSGQRQRAEREAHARYTQAWQAAHAAEGERQRQLAALRAQYDRWAEQRLAEIRRHNAALTGRGGALRAGDPGAVVDHFSEALESAPGWPQELPLQHEAAYEPATRRLVVDWELPGFEVVPEAKAVRYVPSTDQDKETARPVTQRRELYRDVLAQCVLLVVHRAFAADEFGVLDSVVVNGFLDGHDPATGRPARIYLAGVQAARSAVTGLHLEQVSAVDCLVDELRGQLSARPDQQTAVRPVLPVAEAGRGTGPAAGPGAGAGVPGGAGAAGSAGGGPGGPEPDLFLMDPIEFEDLVAELFRAMGMEAVTTQRSGDGGVDVEAVDPTPIRGGRIVVQVKRYRNTVPPTAVRDLFGTVQDRGANKGVLVTTSSFGPSSHRFAEGKPLELVSGPDLVELLHRHGLRGRLGGGPAGPPAPPSPPSPAGMAAPSGATPPAGVPSAADAWAPTLAALPVPPVPPAPPAMPSAPPAAPAFPSVSTAPTVAAMPAVTAAGPAGAPGVPGAPPAAGHIPPDAFNVLGLNWAGAVPLDVCALVCRGGEVLSEEHLVFFNNPSTPDGSVRARQHAAPDRAAVEVAFDHLPDRADRLVLVAAVDPEQDPAGDLAGFSGAYVRLLGAAGEELDRLEVNDGRPGETALALGSFRRRANGDWDFVAGGRGYRGGLAELLGDHGVEVA
ncbi:restriction endonuclease [Streptomyces sp. NPDC089799]|uniref:restriction endonuclease n=1 Tax=Streptomyces sp. NPDC089799 TaxID=3155066 RepID=UPI00341CB1D1